MEVLVDRDVLAVHGTHLHVCRDAGPGESVLVEVARLETRFVRPGQARDRQIEDGLPDLSGRIELQTPRGEAAGGEDERPRPIGERPARGVRHDAFEAPSAGFAACDGASDDEASPCAPQRRGHRLEQADPGNRGRKRRHFEDRVSEPGLELVPHLSGAVQTEHGGEADDLAGHEMPPQLGQHRLGKSRLLEAPREAEPADVLRIAERGRELDGASGDGRIAGQASTSDVVREVGREEILEPVQAHEQEAPASAQVAGGHRLRHERRGLGDADRRRDEEVLVEVAAVVVVAQACPEPAEAVTDGLHGEAAVGVPRMRLDELRQRSRGALDRTACVAEDVDRGGRKVGCPHTLREDGHALTFLGQPQGSRQSGETRADHDRVVARSPSASEPRPGVRHAGRCSTPSRPWKIQSSRRA